jgi:menaquinone-dependent protoporphyrinogen oxidase
VEVRKLRVLVAYESRYGATKGIAERIGAKLGTFLGLEVDVKDIADRPDPAAYDANVIGSAVYMGSWMKEAAGFVRANQLVLKNRPAFLFSSGPLGTKPTDAKGVDLHESAVPKEIAEFSTTIKPRGHRVFFGALERSKLKGAHRLFGMLPASEKLLIEGDFREWKEIESWAESIAHELAPVHAGVRGGLR